MDADDQNKIIVENMALRLRKLGMQKQDFAKAVKSSRQTVYAWFSGYRKVNPRYLPLIADALKTSVPWLIESHEVPTSDYLSCLKVLANVSAGTPELNFADGELFQDVAGLDPTCFVLRVTGDSMTGDYIDQTIPNGAYVVLSAKDCSVPACLGKVVYASVEDGEYSLKQLVSEQNKLYLKPWNKRYAPIPVTSNTRILGVVIGFYQKI